MGLNDGYQRHSMQRGAERYGLEISISDYKAISAAIGFHELTNAQECVQLSQVSVGRQKWAVWYKGEWMALIFDPEQARIVTVLPPSELRRFRKMLPW